MSPTIGGKYERRFDSLASLVCKNKFKIKMRKFPLIRLINSKINVHVHVHVRTCIIVYLIINL